LIFPFIFCFCFFISNPYSFPTPKKINSLRQTSINVNWNSFNVNFTQIYTKKNSGLFIEFFYLLKGGEKDTWRWREFIIKIAS
jgi:hypothetical protein